ncbi:MAG: nucleotidyltransferase family protein [Acidobacteria bacterium]|nr:nucleotidyltransferase family protein [Acidobacteriota bacterium]
MTKPGTGKRLDLAIISPSASIREAIARLDAAGTGALVLCSHGRTLCGFLTDGDVRRAILRGRSLEEPCASVASMTPVVAPDSVSSMEALRMMNLHDINQLPVVDQDGRVLNLLLRQDLVTEKDLALSAVIMAGGFGTRLRPLTEQVPKPMLPVGDRPLLERTLEQLRKSGIREVNLTTHYLHESIQRHFGNGEAFGVRLNYIREHHPLGTAGGLRLLKPTTGPLLVMNGDILTGVRFDEMLHFHRRQQADATVGVRQYEFQVPYGVVECEEMRVMQLQEKPAFSFFINAGTYLLEPSVFEHIPEGQRFDMTDLLKVLLEKACTVAAYPIIEYWLDVGRHEDYQQAQHDALNGCI